MHRCIRSSFVLCFGALLSACPTSFPSHPPQGDGGPFDTGDGGPGGCVETVSDGGLLISCPDAGTVDCGPSDAGSLDAGAVVEALLAPRAISGGTLAVLRDGHTAVAADPDRDLIWVADLDQVHAPIEIDLTPGDEPGRLVEDGAGHVHVALRSGGAVTTIDPLAGTILYRTPVCAAPRGLAYDPNADVVHVACADGELITLPSAGGAATRTLWLDPDLRDVIVDGDHLLVSRFRTAQLLSVNANGQIDNRQAATGIPSLDLVADVAWRAVSLPGGGVAMAHQRVTADVVVVDQCVPAYGSTDFAPPAMSTGVTLFVGPDRHATLGLCAANVLPVDIAVSSDGSMMAIAAAGSDAILTAPVTSGSDVDGGFDNCPVTSTQTPVAASSTQYNEPTAVAFDGSNHVVTFTRAPAIQRDDGLVIPLSGAAMDDTGHRIFHQDSSLGISCASCHPEGTEDGRVWTFSDVGQRRTQTLGGGLLATAPFHWDGSQPSVSSIMSATFVHRMGGATPDDAQVGAIAHWLNEVPASRTSPAQDPAAVSRGATQFTLNSCDTCHSGVHLTNNQSLDIGTGGPFQVPTLLGVSSRPPFLHDGCASTLTDVFGACASNGAHANVSGLTVGELDDLIAYLTSL